MSKVLCMKGKTDCGNYGVGSLVTHAGDPSTFATRLVGIANERTSSRKNRAYFVQVVLPSTWCGDAANPRTVAKEVHPGTHDSSTSRRHMTRPAETSKDKIIRFNTVVRRHACGKTMEHSCTGSWVRFPDRSMTQRTAAQPPFLRNAHVAGDELASDEEVHGGHDKVPKQTTGREEGKKSNVVGSMKPQCSTLYDNDGYRSRLQDRVENTVSTIVCARVRTVWPEDFGT